MDYTETSFAGPEGTTVTRIQPTTKKSTPMWKKILPWVGLGVGLLLIAMVLRPYVVRGGSVAPAPLADPNYGTPTLSGLPYTDQYQAKYAPTEAAVEARGKISADCDAKCNGLVGCTDRDAYNYDPNATCACINCCIPRTIGCMDPKATTFNPFANTNDARFCKYASVVAPARVPPAAVDCVTQLQIDPEGAVSAGCGPAPIGGCTDINNAMFSPTATYNDGSCVYGTTANAPVGAPLQSGCAAKAPLDTGCLAPHDTQFLGGFKGCGDAWDLRKGYSRGAVAN